MVMAEPNLFTTTDVANLTNRSIAAVRRAIFVGTLASVGRIDFGRPLVTREAALAWNARAVRHAPRRDTANAPIEHALGQYGPATPAELAELVSLHPGNVRKHLAILAARGAAERLPDGQWVLIAESAQGAA